VRDIVTDVVTDASANALTSRNSPAS